MVKTNCLGHPNKKDVERDTAWNFNIFLWCDVKSTEIELINWKISGVFSFEVCEFVQFFRSENQSKNRAHDLSNLTNVVVQIVKF